MISPDSLRLELMKQIILAIDCQRLNCTVSVHHLSLSSVLAGHDLHPELSEMNSG